MREDNSVGCLTHLTRGDYWHEMLNPFLLVVNVNHKKVEYIKPSVEGDNYVWKEDIHEISREDFSKRFFYPEDSGNLWARCEKALFKEKLDIWGIGKGGDNET